MVQIIDPLEAVYNKTEVVKLCLNMWSLHFLAIGHFLDIDQLLSVLVQIPKQETVRVVFVVEDDFIARECLTVKRIYIYKFSFDCPVMWGSWFSLGSGCWSKDYTRHSAETHVGSGAKAKGLFLYNSTQWELEKISN